MTTASGITGRIKRLPALLVNQIAAGEVVERPASVVKELVDNAIDAGAKRISVELEQGGIELVRVTDDGAGIPAADLPLAVAPHATSKISEAADLDKIATMGFRGEALASIASVSRLSLRSRTGADAGASEIAAENDTVSAVKPAAGPMGTSLTVRNLFFNTPARRKFLRTPATEQGHCIDVVSDLAMAHPAIGFAAAADGKSVLDVPPEQSPRERVLAVLGKELAEQMIEVHADRMEDERGLALWGMAGMPGIAKHTPKAEHIFLNGRPIRDKTIQHAVREAYRGLIEPGRYPTIVLMIEMSPAAVDVNVHPAKAEVRFRDQSMVHGVVLGAIRDALRAADLTPRVEMGGGESGGGTPWGSRIGFGAGNVGAGRGGSNPAGFVDYFRREVPGQVSGRISFDALREVIERADSPIPAPASSPAEEAGMVEPPRPQERVLQVHNSYVVTQDEHGLIIIDQHALHERVMFETLLARIAGADGSPLRLESQRLLTPVVVGVQPRQMGRLGEFAGLFERIGIAAEPIGPQSVAVQAFPTFLFERGVDAGEFLAELLERADAEGFSPGGEEALHEALDMMACKAAVKAGDRMSEGELLDLLRLREAVERSSNCPHGRPTSIRVTIRELEKRFGRA